MTPRNHRNKSSIANATTTTTARHPAAGTRHNHDHRDSGLAIHHHTGGSMAEPKLVADTLVRFVDNAEVEFPVALPRQGHSDRDVRAVAYRWACKQIAEGVWKPHGELHYRSIGGVL